MTFYCTNHKKRGETAGAKAPEDCFQIASSLGAKELKFEILNIKCKNIYIRRFIAMFIGYKNWRNVLKTIEYDSWIILQHPNENITLANRFIDICKQNKNAHFIALIHDLDSIRKSFAYGDNLNRKNSVADELLLQKCDYIICHNTAMRKYLVEKGFSSDKIICLGIFDYLHNCELHTSRKKDNSVIVAGNLLRNKCEYIYKLIESNSLDFFLELYGPCFDAKKLPSNVHYNGSFKPQELPGKLKGSFGLVWDGTSIDGCKGNAGEYIKYNNPHKCSLFLASNIPVIIWKGAALAPFIEKNKLGILVNSLSEIGSAIENMNEDEYKNIMKNVIRIGCQIRNGYYLRKSLSSINELGITNER